MNAPRSRRWPKVLGAVVAVLVIAVVVGVVALDRILLSQVRKQTDQLGKDLGRPVTIEGVKTKLLGGLGVKLTGVKIGAADGEGVPLLELPRAEVVVDAVRALRSRGQDVVVREAVVEGLRVNVVRFPDGTTNVERLSKKLSERAARERLQQQLALAPARSVAQPRSEDGAGSWRRARVCPRPCRPGKRRGAAPRAARPCGRPPSSPAPRASGSARTRCAAA